MQNFLAHNNKSKIPLASHEFLDAKTHAEAEKVLANAIEPRRLFSPTRHGKQGIKVTKYQLANIQIFGLCLDGPLTITSDTLQSVNIICPVEGQLITDSDYRDKTIGCGKARIDSPGGRVDVGWDSKSTCLVTRIPKDTLNDYCNKLYDLDTDKDIQFSPTLDLTENAGTSVQNILNTILLEADNQHSLLNQGTLTNHFEELFITSLLNAQPNSLSEILFDRHRQIKPFYIKKAIDFIHENTNRLITLSELVDATGVSLRTLQSGFAKYYNTGPSTFIKQMRLNKAREELIATSNCETTVAEVAAKWGFYNPCSFSQNYKKIFGESPSETLRR